MFPLHRKCLLSLLLGLIWGESMARDQIVRAAFLNIVATPHPSGVYTRLLGSAATKVVPFRGSSRAAITPLSRIAGSEDLYSFQLVTWIEIDPDEPTIDKAALKKADFPREGREFTRQYGVNGRVFFCIFDDKDHRLTVEIKNEDRRTISPNTVGELFTRLLSPRVLGTKAELVEVTVIPEKGALEHVLGFERLDTVEILVKRPNADDITTKTNRVLERLRKMKAESEYSRLRRMPKTDGLELDEEHQTLAQVAALNGYVDASGVDANGKHDERSTRDIPKVRSQAIPKDASYFAALRDLAKKAKDEGQTEL